MVNLNENYIIESERILSLCKEIHFMHKHKAGQGGGLLDRWPRYTDRYTRLGSWSVNKASIIASTLCRNNTKQFEL